MLVREAARDAPEPIEVYMIRRQKGMRFLGGYYAFPGGRVDATDGSPDILTRCRGLDAAEAEAILSYAAGVPSQAESSPVPALAYWVTVARELLEESGVLLACDVAGHAIAASGPDVAGAIERVRKGLMADAASFAALLEGEGWYCDLAPLRYVSHFITPRSSPIRFSARFFLCPVPPGQVPRLFTEETSEGFWTPPGQAFRRFLAGEMPMAEPAEYGLAYVAQFDSLDALWAAHADRRHKFHGIIDRIDAFWEKFDWRESRWRS